MTWSMNRFGNQSNIIYPPNVQRLKHVQDGSLIKVLHFTSARLSNTTVHISDKDGKRGPTHHLPHSVPNPASNSAAH